MRINSLEIALPETHTEEKWLRFCEEFVETFKSSNFITQQEIKPVLAYSNRGFFYGLLNDLNIPPRYHYLVMRINGMRYPDEFDGSMTILNTIDFDRVESLYAQYS